jgi:hypothetical protein
MGIFSIEYIHQAIMISIENVLEFKIFKISYHLKFKIYFHHSQKFLKFDLQ